MPKVFCSLDIRFSFWIVTKYFKSFNNLSVITFFFFLFFCTHSFSFIFCIFLFHTHTLFVCWQGHFTHKTENISTGAKNICRKNSFCSFFKILLLQTFLVAVFVFFIRFASTFITCKRAHTDTRQQKMIRKVSKLKSEDKDEEIERSVIAHTSNSAHISNILVGINRTNNIVKYINKSDSLRSLQ